MFARKNPTKKFGLIAYRLKSNEYLIDCGEPFICDIRSPYYSIPLIRLFRDGKMWKSRRYGLNDSGFIGVSLDPPNSDDLKSVFIERRRGRVYGRWYSRGCSNGEFGYIDFSLLVEIGEIEYDAHLKVIKEEQKKLKGWDGNEKR